jgi:hypothetical protein
MCCRSCTTASFLPAKLKAKSLVAPPPQGFGLSLTSASLYHFWVFFKKKLLGCMGKGQTRKQKQRREKMKKDGGASRRIPAQKILSLRDLALALS